VNIGRLGFLGRLGGIFRPPSGSGTIYRHDFTAADGTDVTTLMPTIGTTKFVSVASQPIHSAGPITVQGNAAFCAPRLGGTEGVVMLSGRPKKTTFGVTISEVPAATMYIHMDAALYTGILFQVNATTGKIGVYWKSATGYVLLQTTTGIIPMSGTAVIDATDLTAVAISYGGVTSAPLDVSAYPVVNSIGISSNGLFDYVEVEG